jgi:hypothetical protein
MKPQTKRTQNDTYFEEAMTMPLTQAIVIENPEIELLKQKINSLEATLQSSSKLISQLNEKMEMMEGNYDEDIIYLKRRLKKYEKRKSEYEQNNKNLEEKLDRVTNIIGKLKDLFQARLRVHTDNVIEILNQREKRIRMDVQENFQIVTGNTAKQWAKQKQCIFELNENFTQQMDQVVRHVVHSETEMKHQLENDRIELEIQLVMDHIIDTLEVNFVCQDIEQKQAVNMGKLGEISAIVDKSSSEIHTLVTRTEKNERDVKFLCHTVLNDDALPVGAVMDSLLERDITDRSTAQTARLSELHKQFEQQTKIITDLVQKTKRNERDIDHLTRTMLEASEETQETQQQHIQDPRITDNTTWS